MAARHARERLVVGSRCIATENVTMGRSMTSIRLDDELRSRLAAQAANETTTVTELIESTRPPIEQRSRRGWTPTIRHSRKPRASPASASACWREVPTTFRTTCSCSSPLRTIG